MRILYRITEAVVKGEDLLMGQALELVLAVCAPLPYSMLVHALLSRRRDTLKRSRRSLATISPPLVTELELESGFTEGEWDQLIQDIRSIRPEVFQLMDPLVREDRLTTRWLQETIMEATPLSSKDDPRQEQTEKRGVIARTTLFEWEQRGFLSYERHNRPNPHQSAALVIGRKLDSVRKNHWLPTEALDEQTQALLSSISQGAYTGTWVIVGWQQSPSSKRMAPHPVLLPLHRVEKTSLIASAWQGVVWDHPHWRLVNTLGAVNWAGRIQEGREASWEMTTTDLTQWISEAEAFVTPRMEEVATDVFHELDDIVLHRVGYDLLSLYG
jgi:hypothetical protein